MTRYIVTAILLIALPARADDLHLSRTERLMMARACVHESDFDSTRDCGAMMQVVSARRRDGESFGSALRRTMPRFSAGITDRAWTLALPEGPLRAVAGWPWRVSPGAYSAAWATVRARVDAFARGSEPLPCDAAPWHWFSPRTDGRAIRTRLDSGLWRVAACGSVRNVYLYEADVD